MSIYSPQQLVDQINESYFPELFTSELSDKERTVKLKLARQKLRIAKQNLKSEQTAIKKRWDNRNKQEAESERLELMSYSLVEAYDKKIEISFAELEAALNLGTELPKPLGLATVFAGSLEIGGYQLSNQEEAAKWVSEILERQMQEIFAASNIFNAHGQYDKARRTLDGLKHPMVAEWQAMIDTREIEDRKRFIHGQLGNAKSLIERKQYTQARVILEKIDHPTATKWLPKVRDLEAKYNARVEALAEEKRRQQKRIDAQALRRSKIKAWFYLTIIVLSMIVIVYVFLTTGIGGSIGGGTLCGDGTYSSSTGRGTCSHHQGVR